MNCKAAAELGLEPSGLGRHDIAAVGNVHKLLHGYRVKRKGNLHFSVIYAAGKFSKTADTANEVYPLVGTQILDTQNLVKNKVGEDGYVKNADRV